MGTPLPGNVLLMVKLVAIGLICKKYIFAFPEIFLPFIPFFDVLKDQGLSPSVFQSSLQWVFILCSILLFFNRSVKDCCLVLGSVLFIAILASRGYYSNNKLYCACLFFLAGLQMERRHLWLLHCQIALMYFGAGLNKLLEIDWRSGQYMQHWLGEIYKSYLYLYWSAFLPPMGLGKLMSLTAIVTELWLSVGFLVKRWQLAAVWVGITFHATILVITRQDFGIYTIAIFASYLVFVPWPEEVQVTYNDTKLLGRLLQRVLSAVDFDRVFRWKSHKGAALLTVQTDRARYQGFTAFKVLLLFLPLTYVLLTLLLCVPEGGFRSRVVLAGMVFFFPLLDIIGEWLARSLRSVSG